MIYQGTVRNGMVVLPPEAQLQDGQKVTVLADESPLEQQYPESWNQSMLNGVPVFSPSSSGTVPPDLELVNELRDDPQ